MSTTDHIAYSSNTTITITQASLSSSATAGRSTAAVDNSSNLYDDAIVTHAVKTSSSALANDKAVYDYLYGSGADGIYTGSSAEAQGTDVAVTLDAPTNMLGPIVIATPASSVTYRKSWTLSGVFGGLVPYGWGWVTRNYSGQALDSTGSNHKAEYTGVTFTNG